MDRDDALGGDQAHLEVAGVERLGEVVVGAGLDPDQGVLLLAIDGEEHEVHVRRVWSRADATAELRPFEAGHHPVADDDVRSFALEEVPGGEAIGGHETGVPHRLDGPLEQQATHRAVLGDQDPHGVILWLVARRPPRAMRIWRNGTDHLLASVHQDQRRPGP